MFCTEDERIFVNKRASPARFELGLALQQKNINDLKLN